MEQRSIDKSCINRPFSAHHNYWRIGGDSILHKKTIHTHHLVSAEACCGSLHMAMGVLGGGEVDSGFEHLQSIISCGSSGKSTFYFSVQTKTDSKFEATKHLLLTALRLLSAAYVLEEYIKVISSDQSSRWLINKKLQHMRYIGAFPKT